MASGGSSRHVATAVCVTAVLLATPALSFALSCANPEFTLTEAYADADSIIVGVVTSCEEEISSDPWATGGRGCSFEAVEVLKESVPSRDYSGVASSSGCGLSLFIGKQYLLFLDGENRPLHFSAALDGEQFATARARRYLTALRNRGDRAGDEISEPWAFTENVFSCGLSLTIADGSIGFGHPKPDGPSLPVPQWARDAIDGEPVYRATVPVHAFDPQTPNRLGTQSGTATILVFGSDPPSGEPELGLTVSLRDPAPAPRRAATLTVADRTWQLARIETTLSFRGVDGDPTIYYSIRGESARQIFSAMSGQTEFVIAATVVPSDIGNRSEGVAANEYGTMAHPEDMPYLDPDVSTAVAAQAGGQRAIQAASPDSAERKIPSPVIRVESRSNGFRGLVEQFEACHDGDAK